MTLEEKLDSLGDRVERILGAWLAQFEREPLKMGFKLFLVLLLLRYAKRALWR